MSGHRPWAEIRKSDGPESEARANGYKQELREAATLAQLRRARSLTQAQLATLLDMQQPAVSRLERQADMYLSTLRSYVEAMGGTLQIEAVFPDATVTIATFGDLADSKEQHAESLTHAGSVL
jgi:transcriptional regulator with XRE-family HTH domain